MGRSLIFTRNAVAIVVVPHRPPSGQRIPSVVAPYGCRESSQSRAGREFFICVLKMKGQLATSKNTGQAAPLVCLLDIPTLHESIQCVKESTPIYRWNI